LIIKNKNYIYLKNIQGYDIYALSLIHNVFNLIVIINELDNNINNNLYNNYFNENILMLISNYELFKYLIDKSDINYSDSYGNNVITFKCCENNIDIRIIELLIKKGANIYQKNYEGTNAFINSCRFVNKDLIKLFLLIGYDYEHDLKQLHDENFIYFDDIKGFQNYTYNEVCKIVNDININVKNNKSSDICSLIISLDDNYFNLINC